MNVTTRRVTTLVTGMALAAGAGLAIGHATSADATAPPPQVVTKTVTLKDTTEIDRLTKNLHGQYDVNADYADQIADLTDQLADAQQAQRTAEERADAAPKIVTKWKTKTVTKDVPVTPKFGEDGSWVAGQKSGCAPTALCDDDYWSPDPLDVARTDARVSTWEGFTVGEVIVCPKGWTAADDQNPDGTTWAACM